MRRTDSKATDKSCKGTGRRITRNNSRVIDDVDGPNLQNPAAPSASNMFKSASYYLASSLPEMNKFKSIFEMKPADSAKI